MRIDRKTAGDTNATLSSASMEIVDRKHVMLDTAVRISDRISSHHIRAPENLTDLLMRRARARCRSRLLRKAIRRRIHLSRVLLTGCKQSANLEARLRRFCELAGITRGRGGRTASRARKQTDRTSNSTAKRNPQHVGQHSECPRVLM